MTSKKTTVKPIETQDYPDSPNAEYEAPEKPVEKAETKPAKLPEGVEYNENKDMYRATLNNRHSLWFGTKEEAKKVYDVAVKNKTFWALAFPEYIK